MSFDFTLVLDHPAELDEFDRLFEAGCSDADFEVRANDTLAHFMRDSESLTMAISSAMRSVEQAGFRAIEVVGEDTGFRPNDLEYKKEIAAANMMLATRVFLAQQRSSSNLPNRLTSA